MPEAAKEIKALFAEGNASYMQGKLGDAVTAYRKALAINPDIPEILANLGAALQGLGQSKQAQEILLRCLTLKPAYADALNSLGNTYKTLGDNANSKQSYLDACRAEPRHLQAWLNLGQLLHQEKEYEGAIAAYTQALSIDPHNIKALGDMASMLHILCRWQSLPPIIAKLHAAIRSGQCTDPFVAALYAPSLERENAERYSEKHYPHGKAYTLATPLPSQPHTDGKLRIGYLSSDFYRHATAHLISELFENHARSRFEIYAYSYGPDDNSEAHARIINGVDMFRDISTMNDSEAASLIRGDGIDILVDLKGYTDNHRQGIMALRPAPLQMHYLGYPGTTGAAFIDYFIADHITAPKGAEAFFTEHLIRLPHSYQMNDRKRPLPAQPGPRAQYGLPENAFVFCGFNQSFKITPDIFAVWMRLLLAVEGSVLWLYETHPEASENLRLEAKKQGVEPARIVIAGRTTPEENMARARHADLFLDTFPCNAHTTASDMLWSGVPIVTLAGEKFITRVAASLLYAVGLPELVVDTIKDYEALALSLAKDRETLAKLRKHLEDGRMQFPLFDSKMTTAALEAGYNKAAQFHKDGQNPRAFNVAENNKML